MFKFDPLQSKVDALRFAPAVLVFLTPTETNSDPGTDIVDTLPKKPKQVRKKREKKQPDAHHKAMTAQLDVFPYKVLNSAIGSLVEPKDRNKQLSGVYLIHSHARLLYYLFHSEQKPKFMQHCSENFLQIFDGAYILPEFTLKSGKVQVCDFFFCFRYLSLANMVYNRLYTI